MPRSREGRAPTRVQAAEPSAPSRPIWASARRGPEHPMKPIAVLLLVLVAVGALIFGLVTLGGSKSGNNTNPVNIDPTATAQKPAKPNEVEKPMESEHRAEPVKPEERASEDGQFIYSNELRVQVIDSQKKPIPDVEVTLTSLRTDDVFFMDNGKAA